MFWQDSKPFYFLIIVFQKLRLPIPNDTPVADIVFADIICSNYLGIDIYFETDPGVLFKNIYFLPMLGAVEIYR